MFIVFISFFLVLLYFLWFILFNASHVLSLHALISVVCMVFIPALCHLFYSLFQWFTVFAVNQISMQRKSAIQIKSDGTDWLLDIHFHVIVQKGFCILWMWSLTVSKVLDGSGLCKKVTLCERDLSPPSVYFVWPSCHQQSLLRPALHDSCTHFYPFCCGPKSFLHCVKPLSLCSCALHTSLSLGGPRLYLTSSAANKKVKTCKEL